MSRDVLPVIMSGGSGTRLWPLSTAAAPKQFQALAGPRSMIQETALRLAQTRGDARILAPVIIGAAAHRALIRAQLAEVGVAPLAVALEPEGRNTAATAAIAAGLARELAPGARVLLVPADHVVEKPQAFRDAVEAALAVADDRIVTFGIRPTAPETGYGYIRFGETLAPGVRRIEAFKEKPDRATAERYLAEGGYCWNAGIFLFAPERLLAEFDAAADIRDAALAALADATRDGGDVLLAESFRAAPSAPIDIAVMERTANGAIVPCDIGWADVGSWSELWRLRAEAPGACVVDGDVIALECEGSLLRGEGVRVAAAGLRDMIVVATKDAVLVLPKDRAQDVKRLWDLAQRSGD